MLETRKFKIGLCQLTVTSDKNINIQKARSSIELASRKGANLVVLPEMWNCPCSTELFAQFAENFEDQDSASSLKMLSQVSCKEGITIVGGSIPEWSDSQLYNTCCVFAPNGQLLAKHRKVRICAFRASKLKHDDFLQMHLFDIDIPGDLSFNESDTFSAGVVPTIVDTDVGRIGIGICHDIRFPELAMLYKARGAHLICYPGAFNLSTGEALWEILQRSRAVDNQVFIASCSPSRGSSGAYAIWGHSTLINPLGEVVANSGHDETVVIAEVDFSQLEITSVYPPWL